MTQLQSTWETTKSGKGQTSFEQDLNKRIQLQESLARPRQSTSVSMRHPQLWTKDWGLYPLYYQISSLLSGEWYTYMNHLRQVQFHYRQLLVATWFVWMMGNRILCRHHCEKAWHFVPSRNMLKALNEKMESIHGTYIVTVNGPSWGCVIWDPELNNLETKGNRPWVMLAIPLRDSRRLTVDTTTPWPSLVYLSETQVLYRSSHNVVIMSPFALTRFEWIMCLGGLHKFETIPICTATRC